MRSQGQSRIRHSVDRQPQQHPRQQHQSARQEERRGGGRGSWLVHRDVLFVGMLVDELLVFGALFVISEFDPCGFLCSFEERENDVEVGSNR